MNPKLCACKFAVRVCALVFVVALVELPAWQTKIPQRMVVLISIDGLASYYLDDPMADIPTLREMARQGASAKRLNVSFPSVTWTSHTTHATGVYPRKHGIIANEVLDRKTLETIRYVGDAVYTKDEALKVPTIYDYAHQAGLKTAAVIWPAVRRAQTLDWLTPDVNSKELVLSETTSELNRDLGPPLGNPIAAFSNWRWGVNTAPLRDGKYSELAAYLLTQKQPSLLLLHLISPDAFQHQNGPKTPEAYWSISYVDSRIAHILHAVKQSGLAARTTFFVTADHGFEAVTHNVLPNVILRKEGLTRFKGSTPVRGSAAYAISHGGSASVYILDESRREQISKDLKRLFTNVEGIARVLDPSEFHGLGLPTSAENPQQGDLMLIPKDHYAFSGKVDGEDVVVGGIAAGAHGQLPNHAAMGAIFIAWGNGIKPGIKIEVAQSVDIAPTIAQLLNLEMKNIDGRVLKEILAQ